MSRENLMALILAAGEGKRMKSKKSKVIHKICGKPLIERVYQQVKNSKIDDIVVVVGNKAEQVKECLNERVKYAFQNEQLGTGHAVMQAIDYLKERKGNVLILSGDTPLFTSRSIEDILEYHQTNQNTATVVTAQVDNPKGYGRIVRDEIHNVKKIVEDRDTSDYESKIKEVNSGIYCFDIEVLTQCLGLLNNNNSQNEYYITDVIEIMIQNGYKVGAKILEDANEILGINDRAQLAQLEKILRHQIIKNLMVNGVTFMDPESTYIEEDVVIGVDTIIYPSTIIEGKTSIGEECVIGPNTKISDSEINDNVKIDNSVVLNSVVEDSTNIGPFAYIRPESKIGKGVKIGDFVEVKKSSIGDNTKISHLSYIGDAQVGKNVNIGCGAITVNYDGKNKYTTIIGDNSFVGCNSNLVSPVKVDENAYIAAGSTITDNIPNNALAIARTRQIIKEDWVTKKIKGEDKI